MLNSHRNDYKAACQYITTRINELFPNAGEPGSRSRRISAASSGQPISATIDNIHIQDISNVPNNIFRSLNIHQRNRLFNLCNEHNIGNRNGPRRGPRTFGRGRNRYHQGGGRGRGGRGGRGRGRGFHNNRDRNGHTGNNHGNDNRNDRSINEAASQGSHTDNRQSDAAGNEQQTQHNAGSTDNGNQGGNNGARFGRGRG